VARGEARVNLSVYDISGRLVATVVDGVSGPGEHVARWSGLDRAGRPVASGVYFMRLTIDGSTADSKKMVLLK
jgi:flagellar hook assembly protein FlgD